MPRPKTKQELLDRSQQAYQKLLELIATYDDKSVQFKTPTMNRCIADVICHLYEWHVMLFTWCDDDKNGSEPSVPAPGFNWRTVPALNKQIFERYRDTSFGEAMRKLEVSHNKAVQLIASYTEVQLFEKKQYKWCKSTTLGSYMASATSSHYAWAYRLIKKGLA